MENTSYSTTETLNKSYSKNFTDLEDIGLQFTTGIDVWFLVMSAIFICIGVIGNTTTIVTIRLSDRFHGATYTTIALLAFVDLVALCFHGIRVTYYFYFMHHGVLIFPVYFLYGCVIATFITLVCSSFHVVMLARLRYKLLTFPIQGMSIMPRHVACQSILTWTTSCILGIPYGIMLISLNIFLLLIPEIVIGVLVCTCTVLPVVTYHILKIQKIRENLIRRANTMRLMNRMIMLICVVQILSRMAGPIYFIIYFSIGFDANIHLITQLLRLTSHAMAGPIYFIIYFSIGFDANIHLITQLLRLTGHAMNPIMLYIVTRGTLCPTFT